MKSFLEFFEERNGVILEYRHKDGFGNIKQSLVNPSNKKGGSDIARMVNRKNISTKGPYQKIRSNGQILIGGELLKELESLGGIESEDEESGSLGGIEFKDGKVIKRKNAPQELHLFTNLHGQQCGKIVEIKK